VIVLCRLAGALDVRMSALMVEEGEMAERITLDG
jgi:hypothetical protein